MVYLRFKEQDNHMVIYDYMPERENADAGTIAVELKSGKRETIKRAPGDEFSIYRHHAFKCIEQMVELGALKEKTYAAWY